MITVPQNISEIFTQPLLQWFKNNGRHHLPWQNPHDPYRVWISEIMLQQTQVITVLPYFERLVAKYPNVNSLAQANVDDVLQLWSGLGYYSRGRNLHKTAQIIAFEHQGQIPDNVSTLIKLPGIGKTTAHAICSLAFNHRTPIVDGNVKRVLGRFFMITETNQRLLDKLYWDYADWCMQTHQCREYTQAIMDLGATCCTPKKPTCTQCPIQQHCQAYSNDMTAFYPLKKNTRQVRNEVGYFLCLEKDQALLLEKRPERGIWGGLWCLPWFKSEQDCHAFIRTNTVVKSSKIKPLAAFKHQFTHFCLQVHPFHISLPSQSQIELHSNPFEWVLLKHIEKLALPKPIQKILYELKNSRL